MQSEVWKPQSTEDSLLAALFEVGRMMRNSGGTSAEPHTYWLLHSLRCRGTVRMTDLAVTMDLDTSTVSRHLQQLDRAGLVQRSRHPDDGRAQAVAITAAGEALLDQAHQARLTFVADRTADWDPADVVSLTRLLSQFAGSAPTGDAPSTERTSELEHA